MSVCMYMIVFLFVWVFVYVCVRVYILVNISFSQYLSERIFLFMGMCMNMRICVRGIL